MLTRLGKPAAAGGAVDLLLECHARIRAFIAMARRLAEARGAPPEELRDGAGQVRRYFADALPLHARDEEESLLPRLRGRDAAVDAELAAMVREHGDHGPPLAALLEACAAVEADPARLPAVAGAIAAAAADLDRQFADHLRREEEVIFPAARRLLDPAADREIAQELRERRGAGAGPTAPTAGAGERPRR